MVVCESLTRPYCVSHVQIVARDVTSCGNMLIYDTLRYFNLTVRVFSHKTEEVNTLIGL